MDGSLKVDDQLPTEEVLAQKYNVSRPTIREALKHIPAERLVISSDCGMGREGMSRRHALYKMAALVQGTNVVRKELGAPEAECRIADPRFSLVPGA